ncbi:TPA: DUF3850 domain-containing protein [Klebsiella aerogenes]
MTKSTITREPITHYLKIYPEFFSAVCTGVKRAELRKNDRDYRVGDTLHLMETPRGSCHSTGEFINATIIHIADVGEWMPGYVLLSIEREALDSESVILYRERNPYNGLTTGWQELTENELSFLKENAGENAEFLTLYRHAQPAPELTATVERLNASGYEYEGGEVTPQNVAAVVDILLQQLDDAVQSRDSHPAPVVQMVPEEPPEHLLPKGNSRDTTYRRGATILGWKLCRDAMLQAEPVKTANKLGNSPVIPDTWIPVSERMPTKQDGSVFLTWNGQYIGKELFLMGSFQCLKPEIITHWMPLPAAPQEEK